MSNGRGLEQNMKLQGKVNDALVTLDLQESRYISSPVPVVLVRNGVLTRWNTANVAGSKVMNKRLKIYSTNQKDTSEIV